MLSISLSVLNNGGLETLGVLDVDGLDVGVKLLLGTLLVVTLTRDAHTKAERHTLDARLPNLLVELGVEADILGTLSKCINTLLPLSMPPNQSQQHRKRCVAGREERFVGW